jgi:endonuclease YncB( thermonuclease family)
LFLLIKKGAFQRLFLFAGLLLASAACCGAPSPASCTTSAVAETIGVRHVHDGDTIELSDHRRVRLIGIDAPELARDGHPAQPFGIASRDYLRRLMREHGNRIGLVFDTVTKDKYGRTLAYLFFDNGDSVEADMIDAGLAVAYTTPPDDLFGACYREHEARARQAGIKIWGHPKYRDQAISTLPARSTGFHIIHGRVLHSSDSRRGIWLDIEGGLAIQIKPGDVGNFKPGWLTSLTGKTIRVRGWLHPKSRPGENRFYLQLRHPDNIERL